MEVDTKKVKGRRSLRFQSLDDLLADVDMLLAGNVKMIGNWSLGQVLSHLSKAFESSIDGSSFKASLPVRMIMQLFMKKRFITGGVPAGFKLPAKAASFIPDEVSDAEGAEQLRRAVERLNSESKRAINPVLGRLTIEEWEQFHLRHAELHLSFAIPESE